MTAIERISETVYHLPEVHGGPTILLGDSVVLVETGVPGSETEILAAVEELGRTPGAVTDIVITHADGDHVDGLVALLLPAERILIAGDALNTRAGMGGSSPGCTADPADARAAVAALAALRPDTIVFGHGPSIVGGAAAQLEALDASLDG